MTKATYMLELFTCNTPESQQDSILRVIVKFKTLLIVDVGEIKTLGQPILTQAEPKTSALITDYDVM
jgi:hypothetical protein